MRVAHVKETFSAGDVINYYPISDTHLGATECDEQALRALIQRIKDDPYARWSHGGDIGDLITPKDKRFQAGNVAERYQSKMHRIPDATIEHAVELFKPIADKCWFIGVGNHESSLAAYYDRGIGAEIHSDLGLKDRYLGYRGFCNVQFSYDKGKKEGRYSGGSAASFPLLIDFHHGWQAGRLYGAFHVEAERTLGHSNADIILRGHSHKRQAQKFNSWVVGNSNTKMPRAQERLVVCTGTFMRSIKEASNRTDVISDVHDDTYAERKGYRPQDPLGPPLIQIAPVTFERVAGGSSAGRPNFHLSVTL